MTQLVFQILDKACHDRNSFDCGVTELNTFLRTQASQSIKREISRTQVLVDPESPSRIFAYCTLALGQVTTPPVGTSLYKRYPHPLPVMILVRMAVDKRYQGHRICESCLLHSICQLAKAYQVAAPVIGLFVNAKDEKARQFYLRYGFQQVDLSDPLHLWLPVGTCLEVAAAIESSKK